EAARTRGWQIHVVYASTERDIDAGFAGLVREKAGALLASSDPFFDTRRDQIMALAAHHAMPTIYAQRSYVAAGGLMSYAPSFAEAWGRAGFWGARIHKGARRAVLQVVKSRNFEFVIKIKTARGLSIEVPNSMHLLAEGVVE